MSNLQRMLVCIALLVYGMQSFALADGLVMRMTVAIELGESAMPGCHMGTMIPNDDSATKTGDASATVAPAPSNCCAGDQCGTSCSMTHCSSVTAFNSTVLQPCFVIVKPSLYAIEMTPLVDYPSSFSRPPITS